MADGRTSLDVVYLGDPVVPVAETIAQTGPSVTTVDVHDREEVAGLLTAIDARPFDCLVCDESSFGALDEDSLSRLLDDAADLPVIATVRDDPSVVPEGELRRRVDEILVADDADADWIRSRLTQHADRYRQRRRDRTLWYQVRQLVEYAEDSVWIFTPTMDELLYANPALASIWGVEIGAIHRDADAFFEAVHPADRADVRRGIDRLADGAELELEFRVNEGADYGRWAWVKGYPITDETGTVVAIGGFARDISARKAQERRYRRERDRFLRLFEHFPEPTLAYRFDGESSQIIAVNDAFESIFGYDEDAAVGMDVDELLAPDELRDEAASLDHRVHGGEFVDEVVRRATADGERYFRFRNIELPGGDKLDGFGIYADIDVQHRRERTLSALHATSRRLSRIQDTDEVVAHAAEAVVDVIGLSEAGIWLARDDEAALEPVHLTDALRETIGTAPALPYDDPLVARAIESNEAYADAAAERGAVPEELSGLTSVLLLGLRDAGVFVVGSSERSALGDEDRSFARILAANTEAAIERADREITLREQQRELQQQNDRLEEFTGVVSHDLRTPLTIASATIEQLEMDHDDVDVSTIRTALDRMESIISKTLTLARSGHITGETEPVDIGSLARRCRHLVSTADAAVHIEDGLPTVEADPDRLQHVFENLFRNAVEHGGPGVTITVAPTDDGFAVTDDGPGIPEAARVPVFETGYSTADGGTGFGLAIVRRIIEAHGWTVSIDDTFTGGTRFLVATDPD